MNSKQIITIPGLTGPGTTGSNVIIYNTTTGVLGPLGNIGASAGDVLTYDGSKVLWAAGGGGSTPLTSNQKFAAYWARQSWATQTTVTNKNWYSVCWASNINGGIFCAVATTGDIAGGRVMTSSNGTNWSIQTTPSDNLWQSVCWSPELSLIVAVSGNASSGTSVMTSSNGTSWNNTSPTGVPNNVWYSVCWSPTANGTGLFCAVSDTVSGTINNRVMTSPNGINWTARTASSNSNWVGVCWAPELSKFCAIGQTAPFAMISSDGITWDSTGVSGITNNPWQSICWSPELSLFCTVSTDGKVMTSTNGLNWTSRSSPNETWVSVCWSSEFGLFVAVPFGGTTFGAMTSPDGISWTGRTSIITTTWSSVCWSPELSRFCAVAYDGASRAMTSPN